MSRVVLFGGHGFVGSALRLGLDGLDIVSPTRVEVDLADANAVRAALRPGDVVVNAAGYAVATDRSAAGLGRLRRDNVEAVRALVGASVDQRAARLIHLSSVAAMGQRSGHDLSEADLAPPRSPYGQSKREAELALAARADELPITVLRPTSIFGPGRGLAGMLCRVASLPVVPLPGGGAALIPFSHVDNLVAAVRATIDTPATVGGTFIVGDERSYRLRDVLVGLAAALGRSSVRTAPVPVLALRFAGAAETRLARLRHTSPMLDPVRIETLTESVSYSTVAFRTATGFVPPIALDAALRDIAGWYQTGRP